MDRSFKEFIFSPWRLSMPSKSSAWQTLSQLPSNYFSYSYYAIINFNSCYFTHVFIKCRAQCHTQCFTTLLFQASISNSFWPSVMNNSKISAEPCSCKSGWQINLNLMCSTEGLILSRSVEWTVSCFHPSERQWGVTRSVSAVVSFLLSFRTKITRCH